MYNTVLYECNESRSLTGYFHPEFGRSFSPSPERSSPYPGFSSIRGRPFPRTPVPAHHKAALVTRHGETTLTCISALRRRAGKLFDECLNARNRQIKSRVPLKSARCTRRDKSFAFMTLACRRTRLSFAISGELEGRDRPRAARSCRYLRRMLQRVTCI